MSSYDHAARPQPHVSIPSDRPPPVPPKPSASRSHATPPAPAPFSPPSPQTSWVQYAEAANAQYNANDDYYEGYGDRGEYGYGYGGEDTPNGRNSNSYGNRDGYMNANANGYGNMNTSANANADGQFANPYSPISEAPEFTSHAYHMHEGQQSGGSGYPFSNGRTLSGSSSHSQHQQRPVSIGPPISRNTSTTSTSSYDPDGGTFAFPEPDLHRSVSQLAHAPSMKRKSPHPHRSALSDSGAALQLSRTSSHSSFAPSLQSFDSSTDVLTDELSNMTLESEEGLRRFQAGELAPTDEEWHKLVPETAREAVGTQEVQRQSILFEIFKSERDYVQDLEAINDVIIGPLRSSNAFPEGKADEFIHEVFWNLNDVLSFHQRMLGSLFARQREQHPLVQSVSDIILETTLQFQPAYESYIKHYPLSEARHRTEQKRNPAYRSFLQTVSQDARIRKRDIVTFLSRPVTRLPRLSLLLETLLKKTDGDHPDQESMPLIIGVLGDFVKSTQPGIEAAESKVKYFGVMENLVFRKGEIIDLDEQDASRTLIHSQTLARRLRSEIDWHGWNDFLVVLLDHYLLITREWKRPNGVKFEVSSRPIPLEFLRLGQFDQPSETRKEKSDGDSILDNLRFHTRPQYPFTIYHAAAKSTRRYTLYTSTEAAREKWRKVLSDTIAIHAVRRDANQWFAPSTIDDGVFRIRGMRVPVTSNELFTGAITAAATFVSGGKNYFVVGSEGGIYVCMRGEINYRRVLTYQNTVYIAALQHHNKILIFTDGLLLSYSMDIMARASQGTSPPKALDASVEKVSGQDTVAVAKVGIVKDRTIVVYAAKSFRQTTINALEAVRTPIISRLQPGKSSSFRSFGKPFYVPRAATDINTLSKTIAIAGDRGITIVDPTNLNSSAVLVVPDFGNASSDPRVAGLKTRCDDAKPLGLVRVDRDENMVVYEEFACYIGRHGAPKRNAAIVRWEIKASRFAERREHLLLFSAAGDFIEIRHKASGRLVQVLEGTDIRLLNSGIAGDGMTQADAELGPSDSVPILVSRKGKLNDVHGQSVELFELVKTTAIAPTPMRSTPSGEEYWGEWDM